jgi:hypothetical protein
MYMDKEAEFSDGQALTVTAISTNVIDINLVPTLKDIGTGESIYWVTQVDVAFGSAGAPTLDITLESDSTADLATSPTVHDTLPQFLVAALTAGAQLGKRRLESARTFERYLGVRYTIGVAAFNAGTISSFLTRHIDSYTNYPANTGV